MPCGCAVSSFRHADALDFHSSCLSAFACIRAAPMPPTGASERINAPARVTAVETVDGQVRVNAGGLWYRRRRAGGQTTLEIHRQPAQAANCPKARCRTARSPPASTTSRAPGSPSRPTRYDHGILGDKIEAGSLVIETRDGKRQTVGSRTTPCSRISSRASPISTATGATQVVVVKSYLKRGSALAVIAERRGRYEIVAETPPLGAAHRWLDARRHRRLHRRRQDSISRWCASRMPWARSKFGDGNGDALHKIAEMPDIANHIAGSRALDMAAVADFDGDNVADIAMPSLDRKTPAHLSLSCRSRARSPALLLPAQGATNLGLMRNGVHGPCGRARPRRRLAGGDPEGRSVDGEVFQQRKYADDDHDDAHDLLGAPVDGQHIDEIKHKNDNEKRNQNTDDQAHGRPRFKMRR